MKPRTHDVVLLALIVSIRLLTAWSQNTAIPNSAYNMGIGISTGANTTVQSGAGAVLMGLSQGGDYTRRVRVPGG